MTEKSDVEPLEPWGRLISGERGVSANRIAERLGVTAAAVKKAAESCGVMKMSGRNAFDVYSVDLVETLPDHPDIQKAAKRRANRSVEGRKTSSKKAADTRRSRCVDQLSQANPELRFLYEALVAKLWRPSSEASLLEADAYSEFPARLWDALVARPERQDEAVHVIVMVLWALTKVKTWKISEYGRREPPLVLTLYYGRYTIRAKQGPEMYKHVFEEAIRYLRFEEAEGEGSKYEEHLLPYGRLDEISTRQWPVT